MFHNGRERPRPYLFPCPLQNNLDDVLAILDVRRMKVLAKKAFKRQVMGREGDRRAASRAPARTSMPRVPASACAASHLSRDEALGGPRPWRWGE